MTVGLDRVRLALDPALRLGGGVWRRVRVASDEVRGRYMVAEPPAGAETIPAGTVVCEAPVFALCTLEEWKKRVCAACFAALNNCP